MSVVPLDVQRRFKRRWAGRFNVTPSQTELSRDSRTKRADTSQHRQPSHDKKAHLGQRRVPVSWFGAEASFLAANLVRAIGH
jgi:hypothetical protein